MKKLLILLTVLLASTAIKAQVTVDNTSMTVEQYIQNVLAGSGVTITNVQFNGSFANALLPNEQVGSFNDVNADVGLSNGIILGSGNVTMAAQLNTGGGSSLGGTGNAGVDVDLASITLNTIFDESVVEFDFVPQGDTIKFNYVFASEEYEEYVCASVNDAFGFFLTGANPLGGNYTAQNLALIPDPLTPGSFTTTPVSINTVNPGVAGGNGTLINCTNIDPNFATYNIFYTSNTINTYEYDGRTVVLQAKAYVNCGQTYHIKLAIGDAGDGAFDSGVFIEGGSFSSVAVQVDVVAATGDSTVIEDCADATIIFTRPDTVGSYTVHFDIGGNAIMDSLGVVDPDYAQIPDSVTFLPGIDTASITITPYADLLIEGQDTIIITVTTIDPCGNTIITFGSIYILDVPDMFTVSPDTTLTCPTANVPIYVQAAGALQPFTYVWTDSGGNPIGTNNDTLIVSGLVTDTFYVSTTDSCNLVTINDTIIVTTSTNPPVIDSTTVDLSLHCGESISLQAYLIPGTGTAPFSFLWNGVIGGSPSPLMSPTADSTFYVTVTDFCGLTAIDSVLITIDTIDVVITSHSADATINCGGNISLQATATNGAFNPQYFWNGTLGNPLIVSPLTTTTYVLEVIGSCAANAFDTVIITVDTIPVAINVTNNIMLNCPNETISLLASPTDGLTSYIYDWGPNGPGLPSGLGSTINVSPTQTTTYPVTATGFCKDTTVNITVTVNYTAMTANLSNNITLTCPNLSHPIEVIATPTGGTGPYTYYWGAISPDIDNTINVSVSSAQTITSTITDFCNLTASSSMNVSFASYTPLSLSTLLVDSTCADENVSLTAIATDGVTPYSYSWSNGNTGSPTNFTSSILGENIVTVTVTDECTLQETTNMIVDIINCKVDVFTVISPNGDGENDFLTFQGIHNFPNNHLTVLNRWGKKLLEVDHYNNDWDGDNANEGTYFYVLELNNSAKTIHKGSFSLLK